MQGKIAVLPAKVSGIHEAPSHIGGHTAWYLVFGIRYCLVFGILDQTYCLVFGIWDQTFRLWCDPVDVQDTG